MIYVRATAAYNKIYVYEGLFVFRIVHQGCNHDLVLVRNGIVSHQMRLEKPWELVTNSFGQSHELCGNVSHCFEK